MKVPYLDLKRQYQSIKPEIDAAISRVLENASYCLGPEVAQFEANFAKACGVKHAVGVNSGTSALHLALLALGIGPGDEVITTPHTFVATSWAISYVGAKPVYVDIEEQTFNIDPTRLEKALTPRAKLVLPVHLYGHPFEVDAIESFCVKNGLPFIEDCAQSHLATYKGKMVGEFGRLSCFSFYPGKNLGACGEGGAILTNDDSLADHIRALREHGSRQRYYHDEIGYNYRMEGIQGAVLNVKLKQLHQWTDQRRKIASLYDKYLSGVPVLLPKERAYVKHVRHLYVIRTPLRDRLKQHLESCGIGTGIHYPVPLHLQKCYDSLGYRKGDFPVCEKVCDECLSLPIYPEMLEEHVAYVSQSIMEFFEK